jgi:fatty acid kinase fatty acid binding subunit
MSVSIITDSAASLPAGAADRLGVVVVPMTLVLGGVVYADGQVSPEELMARSGHESVTTSSPSPGEFLKAVSVATEHEESGGQVLVLTVSSAMSATYEVARTAARYVDDVDVRVVDTGTAAGAEGLVVMVAAELAARGASLDQVAESAGHMAHEVRLMAALNSLDHLARSGRVPQAAAWAGRSLGVWPIFEFSSGKVRPRRPARSERATLERMVGAMIQSRPPPSADGNGSLTLRAAVLEAEAPEAAMGLRDRVLAAEPAADIFEAPFSSVMIAHTGPGLVGLAWWWEASEGAAAS